MKNSSYPEASSLLQVMEAEASYSVMYNRHAVIAAAREGVTRKDFFAFAKFISQSVAALAEIIPASYSTLTKKKVYDKETSERIFELAEVYTIGKEVFGSIPTFNKWLARKSLPLGGVTPFSLLDTSYGISLVKEEIGRIDHGVLA
ncbi:MAG: MbcA/ParS/Xre antitoxin family protein [Saprospiraceae bacterium]|nr:MbcA/ParS/Xre antitoxin family protein [Saprospiraceae bacterium]